MVPERIRQISTQMTSSHYSVLYHFLGDQMAQALRWDVPCEKHSTDKPGLLRYVSHIGHSDSQGKGLVCADIVCSWT